MTNGPPSTSAGPSHDVARYPTLQGPASNYNPIHPHPADWQQSENAPTLAQSYFNTNYAGPGQWQQNSWHGPMHPYSPGTMPYQASYSQYQQEGSQPLHFAAPTPQLKRSKPIPAPIPVRSPTPSPPPPEFHRHWDSVIASFLSSLGLNQALRGFETDMLVINEEWERKKVPKAIGDLMRDLMSLGKSPNIDQKERQLDERKLDYVHLENSAEPRPQTSINKSISLFLAHNRARNDASNRNEFLQSLAEKRRRLNPDGEDADMASMPEVTSSCARTDAKALDRDVQMKYDIAKNEQGPLRRTVKVPSTSQDVSKSKQKRKRTPEEDSLSGERHPGLDERLVNMETHLAVRYVPLPPRSFLDRLKFLEDHIIQLEKDYPPWAALHFNQPRRGWPPPPRPTPIIVPSHLTDNTESSTATMSTQLSQDIGKGKNTKSSLHRAVMERLEVQKAMSDLAGRG